MKVSFTSKLLYLSCLFAASMLVNEACQKASTAPSISGVSAFTVVNVIPNNVGVIPVINSGSALAYFQTAAQIGYGDFHEFSPTSGNDTFYAVQTDDTLNIEPKSPDLLYYYILPLKTGGIYSMFLCGADTTSPDYLFTTDTIPYHSPSDSVVGIRFVNLSSGSNPISINLEGSPNGSEVGALSYKSITKFKDYPSNSGIVNYLFVVRDVTTGDSLTQLSLNNNGYGMTDPNRGILLTFKNITISVYGSESNSNYPISAMVVDDY